MAGTKIAHARYAPKTSKAERRLGWVGWRRTTVSTAQKKCYLTGTECGGMDGMGTWLVGQVQE